VSALGEGPFSGSKKTVISFPTARDEGLLVETVGDETVVYDLETKQAHCLKPLAAAVFTSADGATSVDEIATKAEEQLGEPVTVAQVQDAIAELDATALLATPLLAGNGNGLNRRQMIGKSAAAAGALAGASLITSIVAPTALAAGTGIPTGCLGCGKNPDCISNHCCQSNAGKQCNRGCCVGANNSCHFCDCVGTDCNCTVTPADAGIPGCPCVCGTTNNPPGCTPTICCPTANDLCCTNVAAC